MSCAFTVKIIGEMVSPQIYCTVFITVSAVTKVLANNKKAL